MIDDLARDILECYPAGNFRGVRHCPFCLVRKPCPCDEVTDALEAAKPVAPPEQSPPEERGTVNSIVEMAWQVGWMVGPAISGAVQIRAGFGPLFVATTVFYTLGAGLTYLFFHDAERKPVEAGLPALVETGIME